MTIARFSFASPPSPPFFLQTPFCFFSPSFFHVFPTPVTQSLVAQAVGRATAVSSLYVFFLSAPFRFEVSLFLEQSLNLFCTVVGTVW